MPLSLGDKKRVSEELFNIPWQLNQTLSQTDKCQIFMKMTRAHTSLLLPPSQCAGPGHRLDASQGADMDRLPPFPLPFFSQISVTTLVQRGSKRDFWQPIHIEEASSGVQTSL